jgi:hypothetical protein
MELFVRRLQKLTERDLCDRCLLAERINVAPARGDRRSGTFDGE